MTVQVDEHGKITLIPAIGSPVSVGLGDANFLRSHFASERDREIGRYRWDEDRDFLIYKHSDSGVRVLDESTGETTIFSRNSATGMSKKHRAARAYFETFPEPKPWHSALPGEVWDVDVERGGIRAVTVHSKDYAVPVVAFRDAFGDDEYIFDDPSIRDARRVYPGGE